MARAVGAAMTGRVRVAAFSLSVDGFAAGPGQDLEHPLGHGGERLHEWAFATRTFHRDHFGDDEGETGLDDDFVQAGFAGVGAWILGRNMFGPVRGPWPDDHWRGWWGDTPPYHTPVFVLTHHPRPPLEMAGGTTFHFVTSGVDEALARARDAAGERDIRLGGGASTIRQFLVRGLVDEMHLAIAPVILGAGERLLDDTIDLAALGYRCRRLVSSARATHLVLARD